MDLIRSWLFVPGHRQRMIDKAFELNADAIMLDIEDGVAPNEKDAARKNIAESLGREKAPGSPARYVRINAIGHARMEHDLQQQVAEFVLEVVEIATADRVRDLVGFLDGVGRDGREILLEVPRAAAAGRAQRRHDGDQSGNVAGRFHETIQGQGATLSVRLRPWDR